MQKYTTDYGSAASIAAQPLIKRWFERVIEDCKNESKSTVKMVDGRTRTMVWNVTHVLGITPITGVTAVTCKLFEKYLHVEIVRQILEWEKEERNTRETWDDYKYKVALKYPLLIASCCQLAAKMNNAAVQLTARHVKTILAANGMVFSLKDVIESELQVYRTIHYHIPLWTSLDILLLLAKAVGYEPNNFMELAAVMDYAEYKMNIISKSVVMWVYWTDDCQTSENATVVCTLHLCAGTLLAIYRRRHHGVWPLERVADLTQTSAVFLSRISIVIMDQIDNYCMKKEVASHR